MLGPEARQDSKDAFNKDRNYRNSVMAAFQAMTAVCYEMGLLRVPPAPIGVTRQAPRAAPASAALSSDSRTTQTPR